MNHGRCGVVESEFKQYLEKKKKKYLLRHFNNVLRVELSGVGSVLFKCWYSTVDAMRCDGWYDGGRRMEDRLVG